MEVRKNIERARYELVDGDEVVAIVDYVEQGDVVVLPHTETRADRRGQGLAAQVVGAALDDVAQSGRRVVATCWYIADYIAANAP